MSTANFSVRFGYLALVSEHRGYVWSRAVPHTHTSSSAVRLATASAVDALTNPLLPSPVWAWLISTHQVKAAWAYTQTLADMRWEWSGSQKRILCESWRRWAFLRTTRALLSRVSLSPRRANMRGVRRKLSLGWQRWAAECWFGNPGELEAPWSTMAVFNQENVEDYYEIGDELGR